MLVKTVAEQLLFNTIRIDTEYPNGATGSGTGFIYTQHSNGLEYPLIVTNKHVIENASVGYLRFHREIDGKPQVGETSGFRITNFEQIWLGHPDPSIDIAVTNVRSLADQLMQEANFSIFFRGIGKDTQLLDSKLAKFDAIEDVIFIGYPDGIWDETSKLPVIRKGITATPIAIDFEGQPQFLIDASVFHGSSGSPVFIYNAGAFIDKESGNPIVGTRLHFLGAISKAFFKSDINEIKPLPIPTRYASITQQMIDLGVVIKARAISEVAQLYVNTYDNAHKVTR